MMRGSPLMRAGSLPAARRHPVALLTLLVGLALITVMFVTTFTTWRSFSPRFWVDRTATMHGLSDTPPASTAGHGDMAEDGLAVGGGGADDASAAGRTGGITGEGGEEEAAVLLSPGGGGAGDAGAGQGEFPVQLPGDGDGPGEEDGAPAPAVVPVPEVVSAARSGRSYKPGPVKDLRTSRRAARMAKRRGWGAKRPNITRGVFKLEGYYESVREFASQEPLLLDERYPGKACPGDCNGRGTCDHESGHCHCTTGWMGPGCDTSDPNPCDLPKGPFGVPWTITRCAGRCDLETGRCYCGKGRYPNRLLGRCNYREAAEEFGYEPVSVDPFDRSSIFTPEGEAVETSSAYCDVHPKGVEGAVKPTRLCPCMYAGIAGRLCEVNVIKVCANQCRGNGECRDGMCICNQGWFGNDCSRRVSPPALGADEEEAAARLPNGVAGTSGPKKRPLVYVYDMPPEFTGRIMQKRIEGWCSYREFTQNNDTRWDAFYYSMEMYMHELLLESEHRTTDPEKADYFYVPVYASCYIARGGDNPRHEVNNARVVQAMWLYKKAYHYIQATFPWWDRHGGKDHLWTYAFDEGACWAPQVTWSSTMLVHWGRMSEGPTSTTAYVSDQWSGRGVKKVQGEAFVHDKMETAGSDVDIGGHRCYEPGKDIVLPMWKSPSVVMSSPYVSRQPEPKPRTTLFYFAGEMGYNASMRAGAKVPGRRSVGYSMGTRQKFAAMWLDRCEETGVCVYPGGRRGKTGKYEEDIETSVFCGVFMGDGWSAGVIVYILHGCIPVVIMDQVDQPWETVMDWSKFSVRVAYDDMHRIGEILGAVSEGDRAEMRRNLADVWTRFAWTSVFRRWAKRNDVKILDANKDLSNKPDAFGTLMEALYYKMKHDPWRVAARGG